MTFSRLPYQLATFLGATLLFLIQPLLARQILPWFGGGSAVWSACLLFFQLGLVAGYVYAHVTRRLGAARQATLHVALLVIAAMTLPAAPGPEWKPPDGTALVGRVLWLLTAAVGLPYILLSATAPLVQDWFAQITPAEPPTDADIVIPAESPRPEAPYRLYALSNAGSLAALVAYPLLLEPVLRLRTQHLLWTGSFVVFVATCAWCTWRVRAIARRPVLTDIALARGRISFIDAALWIVLSALGSGILAATTAMLTQDVAAVPLLWVVPLALYLATFILAFAGWYGRMLCVPLYALALLAAMYALSEPSNAPAVWQGVALVTSCFAACLVGHGELVRLRPPVHRLTIFYVAIAAGGSLGGAFVALVAPVMFNSLIELPLLHLVTVAIVAALVVRRIEGQTGLLLRLIAPPAAAAAIGIPGAWALQSDVTRGARVREADRGFYGAVRVVDDPAAGTRRLYHGRILHGMQFTTATLTSIVPTYYVDGSGVDRAIRAHPRRLAGLPLKIGVVGLGTGTVAALGARGDEISFFEIDPVVIGLSQRHFTFIAESAARVQIVPGDARLSLERELTDQARAHSYDVIVLDAFSGDAIPVHLLTVEAMTLYDRALRPDGILAVHVSNRFLDLRPVVRGLAPGVGAEVLEIFRDSDYSARAAANTWMLVTRNTAFLDEMRSVAREADDWPPVLWTDDFSSLLAVWRPR